MHILAHADHPELFFLGLAAGVILAAAHLGWKRLRR